MSTTAVLYVENSIFEIPDLDDISLVFPGELANRKRQINGILPPRFLTFGNRNDFRRMP